MTDDAADGKINAHLELLLAALSPSRPQIMRARGYSMVPAIPDGAIVQLEHPSTCDFCFDLGDVALLWQPPFFRIHRIVGIADFCPTQKRYRRFFFRGDACVRPDGWFSADAIRARVRFYRLPTTNPVTYSTHSTQNTQNTQNTVQWQPILPALPASARSS